MIVATFFLMIHQLLGAGIGSFSLQKNLSTYVPDHLLVTMSEFGSDPSVTTQWDQMQRNVSICPIFTLLLPAEIITYCYCQFDDVLGQVLLLVQHILSP